jgi:amino acid transporter
LGILWVATGKADAPFAETHPTLTDWLEMMLLLMFSYGGYESALIPMGEATNPRRDAPFALFVGLGVVVLVYLSVQLTVLATLPDPDATNRPLAASARVMVGPGGAVAITIVALISVYGWLAANVLSAPRLAMAMAERHDLPAIFATVHPRLRTPWVSIVTFAVLSWVLANQAGLLQNLGLSAVSRLFIYGGVCAALPMLRSKERRGAVSDFGPALFRAPAGAVLAGFSIVLSAVLATRMNLRETTIMAVLVGLATLYWLVTGRRRS